MKKNIVILTLLLLIFPIIVHAEEPNEIEVVTLSKCVDANSARFMLGASEVKIRFIAIESGHKIIAEYNDEINGSTVDEYVCSILSTAKEIKIEYEKNAIDEDKYGRTLAWVHVDGVLLQENLIKQGYSKVAYLYEDYKYSDVLREAENDAKEKKVGMWKEDEVDTNVEETVIEEEVEEDKGLIAKLVNFINEIFEKFLDFIDKLIKDVL